MSDARLLIFSDVIGCLSNRITQHRLPKCVRQEHAHDQYRNDHDQDERENNFIFYPNIVRLLHEVLEHRHHHSAREICRTFYYNTVS